MTNSWRRLRVFVIAFLMMSCATTQSRYVFFDQTYPPLPQDYPVEVFRAGSPTAPFVRVSRLDVHLEKTHFLASQFEDALPELERQARLSGAHAVIDIREQSSQVAETRIYHVTATGIRYLEPRPK